MADNESCVQVEKGSTDASIYTDSRFSTIEDNAEEINNLLTDIKKVIYSKVDGLIDNRSDKETESVDIIPARCWVDKVIYAQQNNIGFCKEILERMNVL